MLLWVYDYYVYDYYVMITIQMPLPNALFVPASKYISVGNLGLF